MRWVVEGVTMDGQRLRDNEEPVNFSLERELIFRLYSGKNTARYQNVAAVWKIYL